MGPTEARGGWEWSVPSRGVDIHLCGARELCRVSDCPGSCNVGIYFITLNEKESAQLLLFLLLFCVQNGSLDSLKQLLTCDCSSSGVQVVSEEDKIVKEFVVTRNVQVLPSNYSSNNSTDDAVIVTTETVSTKCWFIYNIVCNILLSYIFIAFLL